MRSLTVIVLVDEEVRCARREYEEVKSKSRQPWEFVKAEADRVGWVGGCCMGSSNCGVVPESTRRNTELCLYLDGPFTLATTATVTPSRRYWPAAPLLLNPKLPELKVAHIASASRISMTPEAMTWSLTSEPRTWWFAVNYISLYVTGQPDH